MVCVLAQWPLWVVNLLIVAFLAICVIMLLTILIQKPQGGGLSAAFGAGASSGQTAFGAKTGDALTIFTIIVFALYVLFAILLNWGARVDAPSEETPAIVEGEPETAPATPAPETPAPATAPEAPVPAPTPASAPTSAPAESAPAAPDATPTPAPAPAPGGLT
jgi:preprotein translocase subunit SecG